MHKVYFIAVLLVVLVIIGSDKLYADDAVRQKCLLRNAEFCGAWQDTKGQNVLITGGKIFYQYYNSVDVCQIMKEERLRDGRPISLLVCNSSPTSTTPAYRTGYMLVMLPQDKIDKIINAYWIRMFMLGESDLSNSCFFNDAEDRQSCDLLSFYEQHKERGYFTFSGRH